MHHCSSLVMIEQEFMSWLVQNWTKAVIMALAVATLTFLLVIGLGLHFHQVESIDRQTEHLQKIESDATDAKEEAIRTRQEVEQLQQIIIRGEHL